jgi:hypothetical protein
MRRIPTHTHTHNLNLRSESKSMSMNMSMRTPVNGEMILVDANLLLTDTDFSRFPSLKWANPIPPK